MNRGDSEKKIVRNVFAAGDMAFLTGTCDECTFATATTTSRSTSTSYISLHCTSCDSSFPSYCILYTVLCALCSAGDLLVMDEYVLCSALLLILILILNARCMLLVAQAH